MVGAHRIDYQLRKDLILDKASSMKNQTRDRRTAIQQIENPHQERQASEMIREIRTALSFGGYITSVQLDEAVTFTENSAFCNFV